MKTATTSEVVSFEDFKKEVINDYKIARISRECSLLGRKEVLTGKAKFEPSFIPRFCALSL